jgi:CRISPR-associated protein (TIGR03986 family)
MNRHKNPSTLIRTAIAPYNFIPLPKAVYEVKDGTEKIKPWEQQDEYIPETLNGWIDLTITTKSPTFIRGSVKKENFSWDAADTRVRPEPAMTQDKIPLIPGSSLRGMIRNLFEILTFSKIQPLTSEKPFFRTFSKNNIGKKYRKYMVRNNQKPLGGFLKRVGDDWFIIPAEVLRIKLEKIKQDIKYDVDPNYVPLWTHQQCDCWFTRKPKSDQVEEICFKEPTPSISWKKATLVLTGSMPDKKHEFVFLHNPNNTTKIKIPDSTWERFHDNDQITQWQERAFPKDIPQKRFNGTEGGLYDGEPVFFLCQDAHIESDNPDGLVFLGRAQMFRLPYDLSPVDLISPNEELDMADTVFGRVWHKKDAKKPAIKGRVFFEDSIAVKNENGWCEDIIVPQILSSPNITTYQHYLNQPNPDDKETLKTYFESDKEATEIRGFKLYWHRLDEKDNLDTVKDKKDHDEIRNLLLSSSIENYDKHKQHTIIKPVKTGVTFSGKIRFENLTKLELGALLSALELPETCCHKIGMAKPLGLGSIRITCKLQLIERSKRYKTWLDLGAKETSTEVGKKIFTDKILQHAASSDELMLEGKEGLHKIKRLDALFCMLEMKNKPPLEKTRYMVIENGDVKRFGNANEYDSRPVLPDPHSVLGHPIRESAPASSPPKRKSIPKETLKSSDHSGFKPVQKGQTREGEIDLDEGAFVAVFEGDKRYAEIVNIDQIPNTKKGMKAMFYIVEQSKKVGIKARLDQI